MNESKDFPSWVVLMALLEGKAVPSGQPLTPADLASEPVQRALREAYSALLPAPALRRVPGKRGPKPGRKRREAAIAAAGMNTVAEGVFQ